MAISPSAAAAKPEPALTFVNFLADPSHAHHWKEGGFEPGAK